MVRHVRGKKTNKKSARQIRHAASGRAVKRKMSTSAIVRCPKCKEGRVVKSRGLTFCGFCGKEF